MMVDDFSLKLTEIASAVLVWSEESIAKTGDEREA